MTRDQEKAVLGLVTNPPPGSELAKAKEFGVDLTLFISTLRRTPTERARSLSEGSRIFQIAKANAAQWAMKLEETIRILYDADVEFVVIGGAAMGLQGSAHLTKDIDFCYARTTKNMERLAKALEPYNPVLREATPDLPFRFDAKTIGSGLNFTLTTDLGDLDFLGEVSGLGSFQEVLAASDVRNVGGDLSLEGLIKSKTAAGRPRDLYVLPELRALNEVKKKTGLD